MATNAEIARALLSARPTMDDVAAARRGKALAKPVPTVLRKEERKKTKAAAEKEFREAVWTRDHGRCRATGVLLARSGSNARKVGEVHHVLKRSTHPEERLNPANGLLLSKYAHALAEASCPNDAGHYLLDISGPADRGELQEFVFRDVNGEELRRRVG